MATISEFKADIKGRKLMVWCNWREDGEDGDYFPISHAAFLKSIGADVPHSRDGLADTTQIDYQIGTDDPSTVFVD